MCATRKSSHSTAVLRRVQQTAFLAGYKEQARRDRLGDHNSPRGTGAYGREGTLTC